MNIKELASALRYNTSQLFKSLRKQMKMTDSLSMTEISTIGFLFRLGDLSPSELAEMTKITTQSMSQILKKLEAMEIVNRAPSKTDGRKIYISLTNLGRQRVEQTRYERDEWLVNEIEQNLTKDEILLLEKAIPVLEKLTKTKL